METDGRFAEEAGSVVQDDLRQHIAGELLNRSELLTNDTVSIFPFSGTETLDVAYCTRLGGLLVQLLAMAIRDGKLDPRLGLVADLHRTVLERDLTMERLFTITYLTERTALDELALHEKFGATSESWPLAAQLVRRGSFDLLAACMDRMRHQPSDLAIVDRLTTLYNRPLFEAVFAKELERAGRFGYTLSLILFDVDRLAAINKEHGYGVGDKILERLGILLRKFFRQHDWVARHSEDSIAVLLARLDTETATDLAEKAREMVEERLGFTDHRTDQPVAVTVTAAVATLQIDIGEVIDPDRVITTVEAAVERGKNQGRNCVVRVDGYT